MNIAALFIRRPVTTTLVTAAILIFGAFAYGSLPVSDLPNVDFPTIQVTANLPGASPETMASSVATPLERQFTTIAGLDSMTSTSGLGNSQITLQFSLTRNIDAAAQDVQTAISRASRQLPPDMPTPPTYNKVNPADQPILYLALTSETLPLSQLNEYGQTLLAERISMISGVAQVLVYGAQKYAVRIQIDPRELISRDLGIDEVADGIARNNVNLPTGILNGPKRAFTLESTGQLYDAGAYRPLIVAYRNGAPIRLQELGRVIDSVENDRAAAWYVEPARAWRSVILAVQRQPGTNTVEIVDAIKRLLPQFRSAIPPAAELQILRDASLNIRASVDDVKFTLLLTVVLVVLVIFAFLRNIRATIIPSLAVPLSIVGTFAVMYLCGFSLDNLSLMALTLSVGFVVDDAVVMLENIVRHMEAGEDALAAAMKGSHEIAFTILSMTISLAAVFIPLLFMGGLIGRLFNEFAVTITAAILISGFISLSTTPMLCSLFLHRHNVREEHGKLYQASERIFERSLILYDRSLRWVLRHGRLTLIVSAAMFVLTGYLFYAIPKGFIPSQDNAQIFAMTEAAQGTSFQDMVAHQKQAVAVLQQYPYIEAFFSSVGARGGNVSALNQGVIFMRLTPKEHRPLSADQIVADLRPKLAAIPGIRVFLQNPPVIRIGGSLTKALYQYTVQSTEPETLYRTAPQLEAAIAALPLVQDVTSDLEIKNPQVIVDIDRDKAAGLGLTVRQIQDALYYAYGTRQISTIYAPNNDYRVVLELLPEYQSGPGALGLLYIRAQTGKLIPLAAVATLREELGPLSVNHYGQLPSVTISFNLRPGVSLGTAVAAVEQAARSVLPQDMPTTFQGTAQVFQSSLASLRLLLLMAVLVIYIVLGILYESFIHPLTILTALPFAGLGALATLMLFGIDLSLYAFVGIIMLLGIVKKNGIMMVDFALEAQRREGKDAAAAIHEASLVRFRPIMMTTMAALFGTLPLAVGYGAGSEARQPLGLAVVGGLVFSQLLTLYVTPVFYVYMDRLRGMRGKGASARPTRPSRARAAELEAIIS